MLVLIKKILYYDLKYNRNLIYWNFKFINLFILIIGILILGRINIVICVILKDRKWISAG